MANHCVVWCALVPLSRGIRSHQWPALAFSPSPSSIYQFAVSLVAPPIFHFTSKDVKKAFSANGYLPLPIITHYDKFGIAKLIIMEIIVSYTFSAIVPVR